MAAFEFDFIQSELFEGTLALFVVPGIAEEHAANVPENSADCQAVPPPKQPLEYLTRCRRKFASDVQHERRRVAPTRQKPRPCIAGSGLVDLLLGLVLAG